MLYSLMVILKGGDFSLKLSRIPVFMAGLVVDRVFILDFLGIG